MASKWTETDMKYQPYVKRSEGQPLKRLLDC